MSTLTEALTATLARRDADELAALRAWQLAVADGLGFVNRAEGQGGYEVAEPSVILNAWKERGPDACAEMAGTKEMIDEATAALRADLATAANVTADLHALLDNLRAEVERLKAELATMRVMRDDREAECEARARSENSLRAELNAERERHHATAGRVERLTAAASRALHPSCVSVWRANPKSPVVCYVCEEILKETKP